MRIFSEKKHLMNESCFIFLEKKKKKKKKKTPAISITKTPLLKYIENFTTKKMKIFR